MKSDHLVRRGTKTITVKRWEIGVGAIKDRFDVPLFATVFVEVDGKRVNLGNPGSSGVVVTAELETTANVEEIRDSNPDAAVRT